MPGICEFGSGTANCEGTFTQHQGNREPGIIIITRGEIFLLIEFEFPDSVNFG